MADAPLYTSTRERRRQTDLADFYALLKASEAVEKAYARGAVSAADYETACSQLMAQFRASEAALTGDGTIASTEAFFAQWRVDCPRARDRLLGTLLGRSLTECPVSPPLLLLELPASLVLASPPASSLRTRSTTT